MEAGEPHGVCDESHLDKEPCHGQAVHEKKDGFGEKGKANVESKRLNLIDKAALEFNFI